MERLEQQMEIGLSELMKKFDRPGPRYTSYPTAPVFTTSFGHREYDQELLSTNQPDNASEFSLYIHFPFCDTLCYFCGCTTMITRNREKLSEYLIYLKKEIDLLSSRLSPKRRVVQMHWGGGTPTYLSPEQITDIARYIRQQFTFSPEAEISVELDPRELTIEHLQALRSAGFNRVSMGVQDFNEQVQAAINRNQSEAVTRQAISWSRELGFASLNMDLIYGLPLQTVESFSATLDKVIEVSPDRIAVYNFAYVPWMKPHQKLIRQEDLPSPETKLGILTLTIRKLVEAGYVYIGMDHFAKANDEMAIAQRNGTLQRNFEGYSTKAGCDLFGLGMSAISHFGRSYAQNAKTLPEYYDAMRADRFATEVGYRMSLDDQLRKHVIMRLMCDLRLETNEVERKFHIQFDEYFTASLEKLQPLLADGLIRRDGGSYTVTMQGRLFLRNIAMCFDAYFPAIQKEKPIFSRTV